MMKRLFEVIGLGTLVLLLANWATPEAQKTSFFGVVTTQQGNIVKLTKIRIGKDAASAHVKHISVYELPKDHTQPAPITGTELKEIVLTIDPETGLYKKLIDLNEIKDVSIPNPDIVWTFQKEKQYRKLEYIEIVIGKPGASDRYLIDRKTKLFGDAIQDKPEVSSKEKSSDPGKAFPEKGPQETEFPLPAIKNVHVEGYYFKQETGGEIKMPACVTQQPARP
jgi:hypothetical protein